MGTARTGRIKSMCSEVKPDTVSRYCRFISLHFIFFISSYLICSPRGSCDENAIIIITPPISSSVVSSVQLLQVLLSVEVRLDIRYPLIALVPPTAPDHVSVIVSLLCISGNATAVLGAEGRVFFRTELVETFHAE
jgi:hypothetical protein